MSNKSHGIFALLLLLLLGLQGEESPCMLSIRVPRNTSWRFTTLSGRINCSVNFCEQPSVRWCKVAQDNICNEINETDSLKTEWRLLTGTSGIFFLTFLNGTENDTGTYRCKATANNSVQSVISHSIAVSVTDITCVPVFHMPNTTMQNALLSRPLSITCLLTACKKSKVTWCKRHGDNYCIELNDLRSHSSEMVTLNSSLEVSFLHFLKAKLNDSGHYHCKAAIGDTEIISPPIFVKFSDLDSTSAIWLTVARIALILLLPVCFIAVLKIWKTKYQHSQSKQNSENNREMRSFSPSLSESNRNMEFSQPRRENSEMEDQISVHEYENSSAFGSAAQES